MLFLEAVGEVTGLQSATTPLDAIYTYYIFYELLKVLIVVLITGDMLSNTNLWTNTNMQLI